MRTCLTGHRQVFISRSALAPGFCGRNLKTPDASAFRLIVRKHEVFLNMVLSS